MIRISVFGLGYVGAVSAACLSNEDFVVTGVDPNTTKTDLINAGKSPIIEKGLAELIEKAVANNKLKAINDPKESVLTTELSLICVGTPSQSNGSLDMTYVSRVCKEIGEVLSHKEEFHVVVCRSTVLPGSLRNVVIPTLEKYSGKKAGVEFGVCNNPEFLREGSAVDDFYHPPKIVIGETDVRSGDLLASIYSGIDAPMVRADIETAEMVKYTDNVWHALKVSFANEIGNICKQLQIDGHKVMDIFCKDKQLNISPYYLKPGFAFGGSCLPKDVRAIIYKSKVLDLDLPIISSILPSNERQIERGLEMVLAKDNKKIGVLGFSFKAGTDDLRESPMVEIIERLLGKGYDLKIYDKNVSLAKLFGANKDFIERKIPHISNLMVETIDEVLSHAETLIIGNQSEEFRGILNNLQDGQTVVDLVRIANQNSDGEKYDGICW